MSEPEPRIVFATDIFMREMKRTWIRQHPSADPMSCPVKTLEEYHPQQRMALVAAIGMAVQATTSMDDAYLAWIKSKTQLA